MESSFQLCQQRVVGGLSQVFQAAIGIDGLILRKGPQGLGNLARPIQSFKLLERWSDSHGVRIDVLG